MSSYNPRRQHKKSEAEIKRLAKNYDFKKKNQFTKESVMIIEQVYSNYIRSLTSSLMARLGAPVKVHIESITQMKYIDYAMQNSSNMVISVFTMDPVDGAFFLSMSNQIAFLCIDSLCGGTFNYTSIERSFTEIEKKLLTILSGYFLEPLKNSWGDYIEIDAKLKTLEFNLFSMQYIADNESMVLVELTADFGHGHYYPLNFILPFKSMEKMLDTLTVAAQPNSEKTEPDKISLELMEEHLLESEVELSVVLGKKDLKLSTINTLKVGDIVPLNQKVNELLPLVTETKTNFNVQVGISGSKKAVQVVEVVEKKAKETLV